MNSTTCSLSMLLQPKEHRKYRISLEEAVESNQSWLVAPLPGRGDIVFHEDPTVPLDNDDWPEESR
ncbi:MAG: hypothetical protein JKP90_02260 [Desulfofustis sp. PB-SRB1]|nr:hypothetical protein [Desulfofustis sp. PB-SRB1]